MYAAEQNLALLLLATVVLTGNTAGQAGSMHCPLDGPFRSMYTRAQASITAQQSRCQCNLAADPSRLHFNTWGSCCIIFESHALHVVTTATVLRDSISANLVLVNWTPLIAGRAHQEAYIEDLRRYGGRR